MRLSRSGLMTPLSFCLLGLMFLFTLASAEEQESAPKNGWVGTREWRRFNLVLSAGGLFGGPSGGLAEQFRDAGFGDTTPGYCFFWRCEPIAYPVERVGGPSIGLTARYSITRGWSLGAAFTSMDLGGATGYRADPDDPDRFGDYVESVWSGKFFWIASWWTPTDWLRVGGGRGVYRLDSRADWHSTGTSETRVGATLEIGMTSPNLGWFVVDAGLKLHLIPTMEVTISEPAPGLVVEPRWTSAELAIGLGLRL